ncbi:hypothetical protein GYMLUDRAFT_74400 [Collybiopsis luxurians FD-317 M1]|uniref:RING-type domain-containing protein n=1 Tax=Collybiopsis luxurians FD-317 M1 TaxID=944289 RepID=A0A0D0BVB3_9AGAR|nr:hypothetical protein GYMLUDRAFT_74400 [Collybiopsis luxurians FD-317 M1]
MDGLSQSTGLPLLSGPLPPQTSGRDAEMSCRKCAKEFNILFTRSRRCAHCGYAYCHSCTDFQALRPRQSQGQGTILEAAEPGPSAPGYDSVNVCAFCIEFLQITAAPRRILRDFPLSKLKKYAAAYNIRIDHAVEKDDVIDAILAARTANGCLPPANEAYYRKYSVPNRMTANSSSASRTARDIFNSVRNNFTNSSNSNSNASSTPSAPPPTPPQRTRPEFARPDLEPGGSAGRGTTVRPRMQPYSSAQSGTPPPRNTATRPQSAARPTPTPTPTPTHSHGPYQPYHSHPPPPTPPRGYNPHQQHGYAGSGYPYSPYNGIPRSRATSGPPGPPPVPQNARPANPPPRAASAAPPPTLDELLSMTTSELSSLSISTLKSILYQNHVNTGGQQILEKGDLVRKVEALVEDEKRERQLQEERERLEDEERIRRQHEMMEAFERERADRAKEREEREQEERRRSESGEIQLGSENGGQDDMEVDTEVNTPREAGGESSESVTTAPTSDESAPPVPAADTKPKPPAANAAPKPKMPAVPMLAERSGLCVVCQDEEANIAIVDCGHLALCRSCCDAIMAPTGTRECPLCRTRIVTEARLLRIFKA